MAQGNDKAKFATKKRPKETAPTLDPKTLARLEQSVISRPGCAFSHSDCPIGRLSVVTHTNDLPDVGLIIGRRYNVTESGALLIFAQSVLQKRF